MGKLFSCLSAFLNSGLFAMSLIGWWVDNSENEKKIYSAVSLEKPKYFDDFDGVELSLDQIE